MRSLEIGIKLDRGGMDVWERADKILTDLGNHFGLDVLGAGTGFGCRDASFAEAEGKFGPTMEIDAFEYVKARGMTTEYCNIQEDDDE